MLKPYAPFLDVLTEFTALPAHLFRAGESMAKHAFNRKPVGNGSFELEEWIEGSHLTLVRRTTQPPRGRRTSTE